MRRLAAALVLTAGVLGPASGCADQQEALIVVNSAQPTVDEAGCTWSPENDAIRRGRLDVSAGDPYVLAPVLRNNLPSRSSDSTNSSVDDSELQLTETVDISLHVPRDIADAMGEVDGEVPALSFPSFIATDSLAPGASYVPLVEVITSVHAESFAQAIEWGDQVQISAEIQFHATRTGNSRGDAGIIDARGYTFPIELCNGCMLAYCDCDDDDMCEPDSLVHAGTCGLAQDVHGEPFSCELLPDTGTTSGGAGDSTTTVAPPEGGTTTDTSTGGSSTGA